MDQRARIRDEIDETAGSIAEKLELIDARVSEFKDHAREVVSPSHHVQAHPWPMFGVAIALGFAIDRLLF